MTLSEIAAMLDLPRATVRRTLLTLVHLDFMAKEGNAFWLTPRVLTFATAYLSSDIVPTVMQPITERISAELNEACAAAVLQQEDVVLVARANPARRAILADMAIGYRLPAYCSALGRMLLDPADPALMDRVLTSRPLIPMTDHTLIDPDVVKARVIADHAQGFSVVDQEAEIGFRSIAVPVRRRNGTIACSLHIGTHTERASVGKMIDDYLPVLRHAAADATMMLV